MSVPPPHPEAASAPTNAPVGDDGRQPRSLADRLRLFLILLVLPAAAVCLPTYVVTHIFGPRPAAKTIDTGLLQQSLQQSADHLLPTPPSLGPDAIMVSVRADHLEARLKKISDQAQAFGGSASEGLSSATEKRLSVEVPAGNAEAFREAVLTNAAPGSVSPAPSANPAAGGKDYVEVVIRAAGDDE